MGISSEESTYWYIFERESELRSALIQSTSQNLSSPYQLWRFERLGDGKRYLLIELQGLPLPQHVAQPLTLRSQRLLQHVQLSPSLDSKDNLLAAKQRLSLEDPQGQQWSGWAFPLRQGAHLLAVLGLEMVSPDFPIEWALFSLPPALLKEAISNHLTLDNYDLKYHADDDERVWLLSRKPELYLIFKFKETPDCQVFHSFPENKVLFTPWGYRSPLGHYVQLPQDDSLIFLDGQGGSQHLDISAWQTVHHSLSIEEWLPTHFIEPAKKKFTIPISLRYQLTESHENPRLWLLQGEEAIPSIETLFLELMPEERMAISLFVGQSLHDGDNPLFILRDDRPYNETPLFSKARATGFIPILSEQGLFIKNGHRLLPNLPDDIWRNTFELDDTHYTLIDPNRERTSAKLLKIPIEQFSPLAHFAHYQIQLHHQEIRALQTSTVFDILFHPETIKQDIQPFSFSSKDIMENIDRKSTNPKIPSFEIPKTSEDPFQGAHFDFKRHDNPRLTLMENRIKQAIAADRPLTPNDWLALSSVYYQEYEKNKQISCLHEVFKTLDQVFYLDRQEDEAVKLELKILDECLATSSLPFSEQMLHLDQLIQERERDPFFARLAFRLRARLLLSNKFQTEQEVVQLRYYFYKDLAEIEDLLMIREHFIYVGGIAQFLNDAELYERAKWRYHQLLKDEELFRKELPFALYSD